MQALRSLTALLFTLAVLVACAADDADTQQVGLSLTITLRHSPPVGQTPEQAAAAGAPPATVFDQGEPIDVALTISNVGQTPFAYADRDCDRSRRMNEYAVKVIDARGRTLDDPWELWKGLKFLGGGIYGRYEIGPGESFTRHVYLNRWVMPLAPGRYTAAGVYHTWPWDQRLRLPSVNSAPVEIEVRPRTEADMKAYVAGLALELGAQDWRGVAQAMHYLGFTGSPHALPHLTQALYGRRPSNPLLTAFEGFKYMTDTQACIEALLTALNEHGPTPTGQALLDAFDIPHQQTLARTIQGLSDPDPRRRADAVVALRSYRKLGDAALDPMLSALDDEDAGVRHAVATYVTSFRGPKVAAALLTASRDLDEEVRRTVAQTLWVTRDPAVVPRLRELLYDTLVVALAAARSLENLGTPEAVEALRAGLQAAHEQVRLRAAIALLGFGDDGLRAFIADAIEAGARHPEWNMLGCLGSAIKRRRIRGPGPDGEAYTSEPDAWIEWLRQPPPNL